MKNILLVGTGWGSLGFLNTINSEKYNVTIISKSNNFVFTPLLANSITNNFNLNLKIPDIKIDTINNVDFNEKYVEGSNKYKYDYVIFSHGSDIQTFNIDGINENCYFIKDTNDIQKIKNAINKLENNSSITVIGSSLTGSEVIGNLLDFNKRNNKNFKIFAIDGVSKPLQTFNEKISNFVIKTWKENNIKMIMSNFVTKIDDKNIFLSNQKSPLPYNISIWCGGIKKSLLTELILNKINVQNRFGIPVDDQLKIIGVNNAYAIGDCSYNGFPPTAQNAYQEGKFLGKYFNSNFNNDVYKFRNKGQICYIGNLNSVFQNGEIYSYGKLTYYFNKLVHIYNGFQISSELGFNILSSYFKDK